MASRYDVEPVPQSESQSRARTLTGLGILVVIYLAVVFALPRPPGVSPAGWRLFGVFVATVAGLVMQPLPGGALVLIAITAAAAIGSLPLSQALSGYSDPTVWLVMAAFFISRSLLNTGLARRIALFFVRRFGRSSLGVSYALAMSDLVLASIIPSNGARSGGVVLPIVRSIADLYGSQPGATAGLLGSFLFLSVYQAICISAATFFTGQASNPLAAQIASSLTGIPVTWASWFAAGIVPGLVCLAVVPWVVMKLHPPQIKRTPEAPRFAADELRKMGPMSRNEWILTAVFISVCGLWVTSSWHGIDITLTALCGSGALLVMGVLTWEDVKSERSAWDIFIWYGGLVMLGKALNEAKVANEYARILGEAFSGSGWVALWISALLIYFYAHYGFASITAHILAMYPAFLAVLIAKGAPPGLMIYSFAIFTNLSAGLTNYGTTPSPMFFAHEYVSLREWWRIGFIISLVNLAVWSVVGFSWWKLIGIW